MRDFVMWNAGWWGMYGVWALHEVPAKIAVGFAAFIIYVVIHVKWKAV
jgi:hypothetical protein